MQINTFRWSSKSQFRKARLQNFTAAIESPNQRLQMVTNTPPPQDPKFQGEPFAKKGWCMKQLHNYIEIYYKLTLKPFGFGCPITCHDHLLISTAVLHAALALRGFPSFPCGVLLVTLLGTFAECTLRLNHTAEHGCFYYRFGSPNGLFNEMAWEGFINGFLMAI